MSNPNPMTFISLELGTDNTRLFELSVGLQILTLLADSQPFDPSPYYTPGDTNHDYHSRVYSQADINRLEQRRLGVTEGNELQLAKLRPEQAILVTTE